MAKLNESYRHGNRDQQCGEVADDNIGAISSNWVRQPAGRRRFWSAHKKAMQEEGDPNNKEVSKKRRLEMASVCVENSHPG